MSNIKPDGYARVVPFLKVRDPEGSLAFYEGALGFTRANVLEQDGRIAHAELIYRGRVVAMIAPEGIHEDPETTSGIHGPTNSVEILAYVDDVDACWDRVEEHGGTRRIAPVDQPWGERMAHVLDPDGFRWLLARNVKPA